MNKLTLDNACKLSTKRLLAYYKKYGHTWAGKYICDCGCGEFLWIIGRGDYLERDYYNEESYWDSIKKELDTREHVA